MSEIRKNWYDGLDAMPRAVIALFAGKIGPGADELDPEAFAASVAEAFGDNAREDVILLLAWAGIQKARMAMMNWLQACAYYQPEVVAGHMATLGERAGGGDGHRGLAELVAIEIMQQQGPGAHVALGQLSTLAVQGPQPGQSTL